MRPRYSFVLPVYNEEQTLPALYVRLCAVLATLACILETCRAGEYISKTVTRPQSEERALDLESERALEHPQMMLQSSNGRRVE